MKLWRGTRRYCSVCNDEMLVMENVNTCRKTATTLYLLGIDMKMAETFMIAPGLLYPAGLKQGFCWHQNLTIGLSSGPRLSTDSFQQGLNSLDP